MMMMTIFRDLGFFLAALIIYDYILYKGIIYLDEAFIIVGLISLYAVAIFVLSKFHLISP